MSLVIVSTRVDAHPDRGERRDALDQRLCRFLEAAGFLAVMAPNHPPLAAPLVADLRPAAVVLSGGNDLSALGGDAPERDATERALVGAAGARGIPVIGICRGLQFLVHEAGGQLSRLPGHVRVRHRLQGAIQREVNSFHSWGFTSCPPAWDPLAVAEDGSIEMAASPAARQWGVMWHPEREGAFHPGDVALFTGLLSGRGVPAE